MEKLTLDFGLFYPKQTEFLNLIRSSKATNLGYGGSRGGMKSYTARNIVLMRRFEYPGTAACILRRTYDLVRENHIDPMLAQFPELRQFYHIGDKELRLPGSTTIAFRYAENPGDVDAMIGKQYMDMLVDQAEQFTARELNTMKSCNRWPKVSDTSCKFLLTFNPGGPGHAELKRLFYDKRYATSAGRNMTLEEFAKAKTLDESLKWIEHPDDYAFLQSFGWDNVEWAQSALKEDGLTPTDYYGWDHNTQFDYFVTRTQYGRRLNALPQAMRIGWLLGNMDQFAGQYFDIWSPDRHVKPCRPSEWHTRWLGIDWGFAHLSACYWSSQISDKLMALYREFCASGRSPRALAQEIVDRTPPAERPMVKHIYLSHDAFAKRTEADTIADQMGQVFRASGMPYPEQASKDPMGRATLLYDMLGPVDPATGQYRTPEICVDPSCQKLIETIPMVCRDPDRPETPLKFEGDDPFEGAGHALTNRMRKASMPDEMLAMQELEKIPDPTARWFATVAYRRKQQKGPVAQTRVAMPWEQR